MTMRKLTIKLAVIIFTFLIGIAIYSTYHYLQGAYQFYLRNHNIKKASPCDYPRGGEIDKTKAYCPVVSKIQCPPMEIKITSE